MNTNRDKQILESLNKNNGNLTVVAARFGVSPRTVGRIRDAHRNQTTSASGASSDISVDFGKSFADIINRNKAKVNQPSATKESVEMPVDRKLRLCEYIKRKDKTANDVSRVFGVSFDTITRVAWEYDQGMLGKITEPASKLASPVPPVAPSVAEVKSAPRDLKYVITPVNACFSVDGKQYAVDFTNVNFSRVILALTSNDIEAAINLVDVSTAIKTFMKGHVKVEGGVVTYKGLEIRGGMTSRIIEAMASGEESRVDALVMFFNNLMENPSNRAVNELFGFLEANDIELSNDGHFYAWKKVRGDYTDVYTGKMDNSPGKYVQVPRNQVDEDSDVTCSHGLHVCSKSYLPHFGNSNSNRVVRCKVNPRDVVAIPKDYNNAKMRCCGYLVIDDVTSQF